MRKPVVDPEMFCLERTLTKEALAKRMDKMAERITVLEEHVAYLTELLANQDPR